MATGGSGSVTATEAEAAAVSDGAEAAVSDGAEAAVPEASAMAALAGACEARQVMAR